MAHLRSINEKAKPKASKSISSDELYDGCRVHPKKSCVPPCPFHAPSDHPLNKAKIHIRVDKAFLVERICEHGVGHDDPDSVKYMHSHGHKWAGVHGCDGCCSGTRYEIDRWVKLRLSQRLAIRLRKLTKRFKNALRK